MLKSSALANNRVNDIKKWMIVPQKHTSDDTSTLKETVPLTWDYLNKYGKKLDTRASSIYRNRPRFSIFGVGDYSFSPWKIAISGLYKQTYFRLIQPFKEKPVVLDDTCYFITPNSYEEAVLLHILLNTTIAKEFYSSYIHWDAKRPITKQILQYLDIGKLYQEIGSEFIQELHDQRISSLNLNSIEKILVHDPLKRLIAKKNRKGESEIDQ